jgi:hypothetical protein
LQAGSLDGAIIGLDVHEHRWTAEIVSDVGEREGLIESRRGLAAFHGREC